MVTRFRLVAATLVLSIASLGAQNAPPAFEVTSVKRNTSLDIRTDGALRGDRFSMLNETLWRLVGEAYADSQALPRNRIIGGPGWIETDRFDVEGIAAAPVTREQARLMLRSLLADRFGLRVHTETRELPVFELVPARDDRAPGPSLRRSSIDCALVRAGRGAAPSPPNQVPPCVMVFGFGRLSASGMTIDELATAGLTRVSGRPTIDRTGLSGSWDWTLVWTPDNLPPRPSSLPADQPILVNGVAIDPNGPPLPTALQEQLGLKLQPAVGPVSVVVIDSVQGPSAN